MPKGKGKKGRNPNRELALGARARSSTKWQGQLGQRGALANDARTMSEIIARSSQLAAIGGLPDPLSYPGPTVTKILAAVNMKARIVRRLRLDMAKGEVERAIENAKLFKDDGRFVEQDGLRAVSRLMREVADGVLDRRAACFVPYFLISGKQFQGMAVDDPRRHHGLGLMLGAVLYEPREKFLLHYELNVSLARVMPQYADHLVNVGTPGAFASQMGKLDNKNIALLIATFVAYQGIMKPTPGTEDEHAIHVVASVVPLCHDHPLGHEELFDFLHGVVGAVPADDPTAFAKTLDNRVASNITGHVCFSPPPMEVFLAVVGTHVHDEHFENPEYMKHMPEQIHSMFDQLGFFYDVIREKAGPAVDNPAWKGGFA